MKRIYIDGVKTRQNIADETGRALGIKQLCEELGVSTGLVSKYIRQGYGDGEAVIDMIRKGIPFELSREPIPSRARRPHKRNDMRKASGIVKEFPKQEVNENLTILKDNSKDAELKKAEWHLLNALKASCESIINQIDAIQQNAVYESIFGGEDK